MLINCNWWISMMKCATTDANDEWTNIIFGVVQFFFVVYLDETNKIRKPLSVQRYKWNEFHFQSVFDAQIKIHKAWKQYLSLSLVIKKNYFHLFRGKLLTQIYLMISPNELNLANDIQKLLHTATNYSRKKVNQLNDLWVIKSKWVVFHL